ncbi:hypothetical protein SAMN05518845_102213 [Variovorax sp. YR750]|nr:hypothetical protein SAMN05518845_102213 [Variovorax sp. YR750]
MKLTINSFPMREEDLCVFNPAEAAASFFNDIGFQLIKAFEEIGAVEEQQLYELCPEELREQLETFIEDCVEQQILLRSMTSSES